MIRLSEIKNRADQDDPPELSECSLFATHTDESGTAVDFQIPMEEMLTQEDVQQDFQGVETVEKLKKPVSGKMVAAYLGMTPTSEPGIPDSSFASWIKNRNGKVYQTFVPYGTTRPEFSDDQAKPQYLFIPTFDSTGAVTGGAFQDGQDGRDTVLNANYGLTVTPATYVGRNGAAGSAGNDDYLGIHLFTWYHGNIDMDSTGIPYLIALEGSADFKTTGTAEVHAYGPTFWWRVTDNIPASATGFASASQLWEITDSPREGFVPWVEAVRGYEATDGEVDLSKPKVAPYWTHSAYANSYVSGQIARSQPGRYPMTNDNSFFTAEDVTKTATNSYKKKGDNWHGGDMSTELFGMLFTVIKYGTKRDKKNLPGMTNGYAYASSTGYLTNGTMWKIAVATAAVSDIKTEQQSFVIEANNDGLIWVGDILTTGSGPDIYPTSRHFMVTSKELVTIDDVEYLRVYTDHPTAFATTTSDYVRRCFMPCGNTDILTTAYGKVDGYYCKHPCMYKSVDSTTGETTIVEPSTMRGFQGYRIMGTEYQYGFWTLYTNVVYNKDATTSKQYIWYARRGLARTVNYKGSSTTIDDTNVKTDWEQIEMVGAPTSDTYVRDIHVDCTRGVFWPVSSANGDAYGWGCYYYAASGEWRECLLGGRLDTGSVAGLPFVNVSCALSYAFWNIGSRG